MSNPERPDDRPHILLCVSGSVATVKLPLLAEALSQLGDVKVVSTESARHFIDTVTLPAQVGPVLGDEQEWRSWRKVGDEVMHIELRRWADICVIAPLSANTLAKLAGGLCDNLLSCIVRAWDFRKAALLVAPAMNTLMWESSFTDAHLQVLLSMGAVVVPPVAKKLACGDVGAGAMASPESITAVVAALLAEQGWRLPAAAVASAAAAAAPAAGGAGAADVQQQQQQQAVGVPVVGIPSLLPGAASDLLAVLAPGAASVAVSGDAAAAAGPTPEQAPVQGGSSSSSSSSSSSQEQRPWRQRLHAVVAKLHAVVAKLPVSKIPILSQVAAKPLPALPAGAMRKRMTHKAGAPAKAHGLPGAAASVGGPTILFILWLLHQRSKIGRLQRRLDQLERHEGKYWLKIGPSDSSKGAKKRK